MFDWIKSAKDKIGEVTKQIDIPIPQALINKRLAEAVSNGDGNIESIKSLAIDLHDGYFDVLAEIQQNGITTSNKLSLAFTEFDCNFGSTDKQRIVIRQKSKPEISGKNWWSKAVVGTVRGIMEVATKSDLPQWVLGKVDGITVQDDDFIFDLIKLDVKTKLVAGILAAISQDHPLLKFTMEKAIEMYSINGATCQEGKIILHLQRN